MGESSRVCVAPGGAGPPGGGLTLWSLPHVMLSILPGGSVWVSVSPPGLRAPLKEEHVCFPSYL